MPRLFLYGTLLNPGVLAARAGRPRLGARLRPASLPGFQRVALKGGRWPTLARAGRRMTEGAVIETGGAALARLAAYEGPDYRLARVVVRTARGNTTALCWIAPGGTRLPWRGKP